MKKILGLVLSICMMVTILCTPVAAATKTVSTPSEIKTAKVVIDSKLCAYNTLLSGKTILVPAQQIGKGIGITNAKKIIFNSKKKTISMVKGKDTLLMTVGSTAARLNGKKVTLDVAPYIFKNTPYVPAKSVAQAFGRKVVVDTSLNVVAITTNASFNEVKTILTKALDSSNSCNSFSAKSRFVTEEEGEKVVVEQLVERNKKDSIVHIISTITEDGVVEEEEQYFDTDTLYMKMLDKWYIEPMDMKTFMDSMKMNDKNVILESTDLVIALLAKVPSKSLKEIILQGDLFCKQTIDPTLLEIAEYTKLNVKYTIDKETMKITGTNIVEVVKFMGIECKANSDLEIAIVDDYKIVVPEEAKSGALID